MVENQLDAFVGVVAVDGVVVGKADALAPNVIQFPGLAAFGRGGQLAFDVKLGFVGLGVNRKREQQCGCK